MWPNSLSISVNHPGFLAMRMLDGKVIWVNPEWAADESLSTDVDLFEVFRKRFACMIPNSERFASLRFDHSAPVELLAERYGGCGIGYNGGGVRCGNLGNYQIKGIGRNLLAGARTDVHHTYGGLKAAHACHEAIYAVVLNHVLPLGAAKVYGVLLTGADAAYRKGLEPGWGALLVRESVVRPGNFLRAGNFSPAAEDRHLLADDVARVRVAMRELLRQLGGADQFIVMLSRFLKNCANQCTFARIARLMHGALTPSNICIDGRWLDLTNTTFLPSRDNHGGGNRDTACFYEEMGQPLIIAREFFDTFAKYNGLRLDFRPLETYFDDVSAQYLRRHVCHLFSIPFERLPVAARVHLGRIARHVTTILSSGRVVYDTWPTVLPADDPIGSFIEFLFMSHFDRPRAAVRSPGMSAWIESHCCGVVDTFNQMIEASWRGEGAVEPLRCYVFRLALLSIRPARLAELFFKWRMESTLWAAIEGEPSNIEALMGHYVGACGWIFSKNRSDITVLRSDAICVEYRGGQQLFVRCDATRGEWRAFGSAEFSSLAARTGPVDLLGLDCSVYLAKVADLLQVLDTCGELNRVA
ncbi:hypothetical protein [Burkholderia sp. LMU1-1-1.1]|uniref:hypothetical protein n=1 Tax=Burkholderia sp. LMU1-1-1.1 TaxID=3135266 RepID=UPI00344481E0